MVKAIFFDMGGVLIDLYLDRCADAFYNVAGLKQIRSILDPWHQRGFLNDAENGTLDYDGYMKECLSLCKPGTTVETILYCQRQFFGEPSPKSINCVRRLSGEYELFLLSNNNAVSMSVLRPLFEEAGLPLDSSFKKLFLSYEMHLLKPSEAIYLKAIEESGHAPGEILFVDDSQANLDAAAKLGINTVLYSTGDDLGALLDAALARLAR